MTWNLGIFSAFPRKNKRIIKMYDSIFEILFNSMAELQKNFTTKIHALEFSACLVHLKKNLALW
jgi:hypothetical protein